jgi:FKBP-type peptidyl-prolyl cis-trans isomerase 2
MIENGKQVAIEYSVFTEDHMQIDSNVGEEPLVFLSGANQILPALEESLQGLDVGDTKKVTLPPEKAYGEINPLAYREIDAKVIPEDLRFEGALLIVTDEQLGEMLIRIDSLQGDKAVLDFNHPLAGKTLTFDVKVLDIA